MSDNTNLDRKYVNALSNLLRSDNACYAGDPECGRYYKSYYVGKEVGKYSQETI